MVIAKIRFGSPVPRKLTSAIVKMDPGKAISMSDKRIKTASKAPPQKPAIVPIRIPTTEMIAVTTNAIKSDVFPP